MALNKKDVNGASENIKNMLPLLPIHGAEVAVKVCASSEMNFVLNACEDENVRVSAASVTSSCENNVWACLQQALTLHPPILIFPVQDMDTNAPLPFLADAAFNATTALSPSMNHTKSLMMRGGSAPQMGKLMNVILMRGGSTVGDLYEQLKHMKAVHGMFVRAEGKSLMSDKGKQLKKEDLLNVSNRIIKIMTNKNRQHR